MALPLLIQGGMGAGVSGWRLAQSVAREGQLGVVSGTALDTILVRTLQLGDPEGHYRRALAMFPVPAIAERVLAKYYISGGKKPGKPFVRLPLLNLPVTREQNELIVLANFAEITLAREGHDGQIGLNLLEKIQIPNLASIYGAMLAGVDFVLMGAGIPWQYPGALDRFVNHEVAKATVNVEHAQPGEVHEVTFDPSSFGQTEPLKRPKFLAIISSATLAQALVKRATGKIDGFIIESPLAGGHNAPPRGQLKLTEKGEPIYGPRDEVDWAALRKLGVPFWIAGYCALPGKLQEARDAGAQGLQVGTLFAFCEESGLTPAIKEAVIARAGNADFRVFTDPTASPTGFPFKVVPLEDSLADGDLYEDRERICDLGYLRHLYRRADGTIGYRCPSEPVADYVRKEGDEADTHGRKCLCNGLMANIGLGQVRADGYAELPLVTAGDGLDQLARFLGDNRSPYASKRVINYLLS